MGLAARIRDMMYHDEDYEEEELREAGDYDAEAPAENPSPSGTYQVVLMKPQRFEDASDIADHLLQNHIVILNLEAVPKDLARRLIDFLGGAAYARNGQFKHAATDTYIITPYIVDVMENEMDALDGVSAFL